ncbi:hypothetical protein [Acinetobacter haemolyticus]|uniref:hypothetical protein n=1 Tax=Acinetobacter haemolyticus TaxID=29430 RepID=UPI000D69B96D|nr:hypothetical protein [Acinetobacter haemolyticus]
MNYLQNAQDQINNFALDNTEMAQEFSARLGQQLHSLFNSEWDSKEDIYAIVLGENDVLEQICNEHDIDTSNGEGDVDFDWLDARDLQHTVINAVSDFYNLS